MPIVTPGYTFTGTTDPITYTKLNLLAQPTVAAVGPNDVTTTTIADLAVTTAKIANNAVTLAKVVAAASNNTFLARSTAGAGNFEAVDTNTTGLGFYTGAGGTVTQLTSKSTAFTLNKMCGQFTTDGAALAANTSVSATWTNSKIAATDVVILNHSSGGTFGSYHLNIACGAGTALLTLRNISSGSLSEALTFNFVVIKGVTS
jgi:hypothetical protein